MYNRIEKDKMWRLSSGQFVEEVMQGFTKKLNWGHPSCSLILDIDDENWNSVFSVAEIDEIRSKCVENSNDVSFPTEVVNFLNDTPKTAVIHEIFNHFNVLV
ncbi:hypothetical protein BD770DRAFT_449440 [Pilaira anomala]|nr:hypothetical protein BD770DRAFT_449440 [Pilaira anomala]